jgi:hypothetical protein
VKSPQPTPEASPLPAFLFFVMMLRPGFIAAWRKGADIARETM